MIRRMVAFGIASTAAVALVVSSGCTQDSRITAGSASVIVRGTVVSPPPPRWDTALLPLSRVCVRALDPVHGGGEGTCGMDLVADPVPLDLLSQTTVTFFETSVPAGTYRLESLHWFPPTLQDSSASPSAPTCFEKIADVPPPLTTGIQLFPERIVLASPIEFTVGPGGTVRIDVEVNAGGMVEDYETRWTCADTPGDVCLLEPAPCLFDYDENFYAAMAQYLSVTVE